MTLASCEDRIAAVIVTPDESEPRNKMFLREVRELTSAEGALLIWRAPVESMGRIGNPPEFYGIKPDITCYEDQNHAAS
jgi:glutamate-1-semialdehyde aminotransferase